MGNIFSFDTPALVPTSKKMYYYLMADKKTKWHIVYYEDKKGSSQVFEFIEKRKEGERAKVLAFLSLLEDRGPQLPRPYADFLEDGIHELRVKLSGNQVRVLYFFCYRDFIVLTNVFTKTSDIMPPKEIKRPRKLVLIFLNVMLNSS